MSVICIGEALIDFVCNDVDKGLQKGKNYQKHAGGAPANVAACIARLGEEAAFLGAVGIDPFGDYLMAKLESMGVNTGYVQRVAEPTTMAFVSLYEDGERDFVFNRGADAKLAMGDAVEFIKISNANIYHFGSATALLGETLFDSYSTLSHAAKAAGKLICFDPNYRHDLWQNNIVQFINKCDSLLKLADIVKVSEEELGILTECQRFADGCQKLHHKGIKLVFVTLGSNGCLVSFQGRQAVIPAYDLDVLDTTGAGDAFIGAVLYCFSELSSFDSLTEQRIFDAVSFAEKVSGLVCTKLGAMSALPTKTEVESMAFSFKL